MSAFNTGYTLCRFQGKLKVQSLQAGTVTVDKKVTT